MDDLPASSHDLRRALSNVARIQEAFLAELHGRCGGDDPRFGEAFRAWQLLLTDARLQLLLVEQQLLHYLLVPQEFRPWRELPRPTRAEPARHRQWQDLIAPWLRSLHIDTTYRRIARPLDPRAEAATADLLTDLSTVAAVCDATGATLAEQVDSCDDEILEELAFYHLLAPWKERATDALFDCLRWFDAFLGEHELL